MCYLEEALKIEYIFLGRHNNGEFSGKIGESSLLGSKISKTLQYLEQFSSNGNFNDFILHVVR